MRAVFVAAVLLVPLAAGCFDPSPLPRCRDAEPWDGGPEGELCVDGRLRTFLAAVPDGDGPFPLLVALHGGAGHAENMAHKTHLDERGPEEGVVVLFPQGTPAVRGGDVRTWNAVHCCGRAWNEGTDDVAFLDALLEAAQDALPIDEDRIGITGHSNGAMMAHRYGAERSERVCCIMPIAGTVGGATPPDAPMQTPVTPMAPVRVLIVHAMDDPRVPYDGGEGQNLGEQRLDLSVDESAAFWRHAGSTVRIEATEGGHGWPGGESDVAPAPAEPDATGLALAWLKDDA